MPPRTQLGDPLTPRQQAVYDFVRGYYLKHGVAPSLKEVSASIGSAHRTGAFSHLQALVRKGRLRRAEMHRTGPSGGATYVPADAELVVTRTRDAVRVAMSGPGVTMTRGQWREWLTRELERAGR